MSRQHGLVSGRVARTLRQLRTEAGLSTYQLADKLKAIGWPMGANVITRIEQGDRCVDVDDLVALAMVLNCSPNRLLMPDPWNASHQDAGVVTHEVSAGLADMWAWARGHCPLRTRGAGGNEHDPALADGFSLPSWQLHNAPNKFPEVLEALGRAHKRVTRIGGQRDTQEK